MAVQNLYKQESTVVYLLDQIYSTSYNLVVANSFSNRSVFSFRMIAFWTNTWHQRGCMSSVGTMSEWHQMHLVVPIQPENTCNLHAGCTLGAGIVLPNQAEHKVGLGFWAKAAKLVWHRTWPNGENILYIFSAPGKNGNMSEICRKYVQNMSKMCSSGNM